MLLIYNIKTPANKSMGEKKRVLLEKIEELEILSDRALRRCREEYTVISRGICNLIYHIHALNDLTESGIYMSSDQNETNFLCTLYHNAPAKLFVRNDLPR